MPSPLWTGRPLLAQQPDGPVLVVYPGLTPRPLIDAPVSDPLAELRGHTRAAILGLTFTERSTGELARELGVSAGRPVLKGWAFVSLRALYNLFRRVFGDLQQD